MVYFASCHKPTKLSSRAALLDNFETTRPTGHNASPIIRAIILSSTLRNSALSLGSDLVDRGVSEQSSALT